MPVSIERPELLLTCKLRQLGLASCTNITQQVIDICLGCNLLICTEDLIRPPRLKRRKRRRS